MEFKVYLTVYVDVEDSEEDEQFDEAYVIIEKAINRFSKHKAIEIIDEEIE